MRRVLWLVLIGLLWAGTADATNWYVRPSGGSGSGTNWTTAWNGLNNINWSSVACGDTVWVAGGAYSGTMDMTVQKLCTSGTVLSVRRARTDATEVTGATGYNVGHTTVGTVAQTNAGVTFHNNLNYLTISGATTASGGATGWTITDLQVDATPVEFWASFSTNHITMEYIDILGGVGIATSNPAGLQGSRGIDDTPMNAGGQENIASFHTFSHVNIQGFCTSIYANGVNNFLFDNGSMYDMQPGDAGPADCHPQLMYIGNAANGTVRNSRFSNGIGEGLAWSDAGSWGTWNVYGNTFRDLTKALSVQDANAPLNIYNNTFDNNSIGNMVFSAASCSGNTKNNIFFSTGGSISCGTTSNNLTSSNTAIFVNRAGHDYHIVTTIGSGFPRNLGTNLGAPYNFDMDGSTRGADGTWDVGAYEFATGGDVTPPAAPVNLRIQ